MADKPQYAKPASQLDLEARLENGNKSDRVLTSSDNYEAPEPGESERTYAVEGNDLSNYVGTASEYATYANETEQPLKGDGNVEEQVAEEFVKAAGPVAMTYEAQQEQAKEESGDEKTDSSKTTTAAKKTTSSGQAS